MARNNRERALDAALEFMHGQTFDIENVLAAARRIEDYLEGRDNDIDRLTEIIERQDAAGTVSVDKLPH